MTEGADARVTRHHPMPAADAARREDAPHPGRGEERVWGGYRGVTLGRAHARTPLLSGPCAEPGGPSDLTTLPCRRGPRVPGPNLQLGVRTVLSTPPAAGLAWSLAGWERPVGRSEQGHGAA